MEVELNKADLPFPERLFINKAEDQQPVPEEPTRTPYSGRRQPHEWEGIKPHFLQLYLDENYTLKETMEELALTYGFHASEDQYKTKITEWKAEKKINRRHMKHMIKIREDRRSGIPSKETRFRLRGRTVDEAKIDRYEEDVRKGRRKLLSDTPSGT